MSSGFNSFKDVANYIDKSIDRLRTIKRTANREVGKLLVKEIKGRHGKYGYGWNKSYSSPNSPLLKTGALRRAVTYNSGTNGVEVYSKKEWLAVIHEYGITYKMTKKQKKFLAILFKGQKRKGRPRNHWGSGIIKIPARPIWRRALSRNDKKIIKTYEINLDLLFN